jgi:glycosyltransferase involved in cell wall biosynthesis
MFNDLPKYSSLLIISDTPMWQTKDGVSVFEPTLREVEWLGEMFEHITWMGYGHGEVPKSFARQTSKLNINFIVLPYAVGGSSLLQKVRILPFIPKILLTILRQVRNTRYVHTRGPSVPALITILISYADRSRIYWHKYAGNWMQKGTPWAYALQRFLLRHNPHKVSVNGAWHRESTRLINLENPCLTSEEFKEATVRVPNKQTGLINICFVGALTPAKGINLFLKSLSLIKTKNKVGEIFIAGDGPDRISLQKQTAALNFQVSFLGNLKRDAINEVYFNSHIIVLPTTTEGFPKVIAEAAAFGCVPVVSDVSAIGQYVKDEINGILLRDTEPKTIANAIDQLLENDEERIAKAMKLVNLAELFTYERYCKRVQNEILK